MIALFDDREHAETFARRSGYTVGIMQGGDPRGLMPAAEVDLVAKWRNLSPADRDALHGVLRRDGDLFVVEIFEKGVRP